ncbi:unnamed protein product [Arabidopsis thaliana]|uniref:Uncharacterized protein n=1 Tax=Arabidopsis thaliana TaxID=3702 RepID=Q9LT46_ARATH|nr:unnamed protein product [Arabidopsis thaliana]
MLDRRRLQINSTHYRLVFHGTRELYAVSEPTKPKRNRMQIKCIRPRIENSDFELKVEIFYPISTSGNEDIEETSIKEVENNSIQRFLPFLNPIRHFVRFLIRWSQRPNY